MLLNKREQHKILGFVGATSINSTSAELSYLSAKKKLADQKIKKLGADLLHLHMILTDCKS